MSIHDTEPDIPEQVLVSTLKNCVYVRVLLGVVWCCVLQDVPPNLQQRACASAQLYVVKLSE